MKHQRQQNRPFLWDSVKLLLPIMLMVFFLGWWSQAIHKDTSRKPSQEVPPPNRFLLSETAAQWSGQPIYRLKNISGITLNHVVIKTWTQNLAPLLYAGANPPEDFSSTHPLSVAKIDVKPGYSLWFVGGHEPNFKVIVSWYRGSLLSYQTYSVRGKS